MDNGSDIWGYKSFSKIDAIQNKPIRIYLGVHRFVPTAVVRGDMGWAHSSVRRKVCMIRIWNRIVSLDNTRLPRKLLEWDINCKERLEVLISSLYYPLLTRLGLFKQETWSALKQYGHVYMNLIVISGKLNL